MSCEEKVTHHMNPKPNTALAKPDPKEDGLTHINTHSQGKTELGRLLAHYSHVPFCHPYYGPFWCVEGFIHYVRGGAVDDAYRRMVGHQVKRHTSQAKVDGTYVEHKIKNLNQVIMAANHAMISQTPSLMAMLVASELPFDHYYLLPSGHPIRPKGAAFLIHDFTRLREMFRADEKLTPLDYPDIYQTKQA